MATISLANGLKVSIKLAHFLPPPRPDFPPNFARQLRLGEAGAGYDHGALGGPVQGQEHQRCVQLYAPGLVRYPGAQVRHARLPREAEEFFEVQRRRERHHRLAGRFMGCSSNPKTLSCTSQEPQLSSSTYAVERFPISDWLHVD